MQKGRNAMHRLAAQTCFALLAWFRLVDMLQDAWACHADAMINTSAIAHNNVVWPRTVRRHSPSRRTAKSMASLTSAGTSGGVPVHGLEHSCQN